MAEQDGQSNANSVSQPAPTPSESQPTASQQLNPGFRKREKVALKPGHTLADWYNLARSGKNLVGSSALLDPMGGRILRKITTEEVALHNTEQDCWVILRGRVYDVTKYLDFHPGGIPKLMLAAGKDATSLFDKYHAWVNIDTLLSACQIGIHVGQARPPYSSPPAVPN